MDLLDLAREQRRRRRNLRALPSLLAEALLLCWRASPRDVVLTFGVQLLGSALLGAQVLLGREALQAVLAPQPGGRLAAAAGPLLVLAAVTLVATASAAVRAQRMRLLGELVQRSVWSRVLDVTTGVELVSFDDPAFADRLERVSANALSRPLAVAQGLVGVLGGLVGAAGLALSLLVVHPLLVPLLLLAGVPLFLLQRRGGRSEFDFAVAQTPAFRQRDHLRVTMTGRADAKEIRAYGLAGALRGRYEDLYGRYLAALARQVRRRVVLALAGSALTAVAVLATLVALLWLVDSGRLSLADAGAAAVAVPLLGGRLQQLASGAAGLLESGLFLDDLRGFLALAPRPRPAARPARPLPPFAELRADDVGFTYPQAGAPALQGVSLRIRRGEVVALVGENGSGKTTLAKVLAGLYAPTSGTLRWDGADLAWVEREAVREHVAVVFQDFARFRLTAFENIALGRADTLDAAADPGLPARVEDAARRAGADGFLRALPQGYATPLGTELRGGVELSGGQWQRVALARAFHRGAPFVILDEPTAALDARAEAELFAQVRGLMAGRSVLLISHRFSSVREADRIYVLRGGRLDDTGTHEELLARGGHYAELYRLQARAYAQDTPGRGQPDGGQPDWRGRGHRPGAGTAADVTCPGRRPGAGPDRRPDGSHDGHHER
ncbi:ABC transporter ATP-binding protein [Kineococcus sp. NUM-3379]